MDLSGARGQKLLLSFLSLSLSLSLSDLRTIQVGPGKSVVGRAMRMPVRGASDLAKRERRERERERERQRERENFDSCIRADSSCMAARYCRSLLRSLRICSSSCMIMSEYSILESGGGEIDLVKVPNLGSTKDFCQV